MNDLMRMLGLLNFYIDIVTDFFVTRYIVGCMYVGVLLANMARRYSRNR